MKKKVKNRKKLKKPLAILKKLLYNNPCVMKITDKILQDARLAQLVEHLTLNQGVQGSNP